MIQHPDGIEREFCAILSGWVLDHDRRHTFIEEMQNVCEPIWKSWNADGLTDGGWYDEAMQLSLRYGIPLRITVEACLQFSMSWVLWNASRQQAAAKLAEMMRVTPDKN